MPSSLRGISSWWTLSLVTPYYSNFSGHKVHEGGTNLPAAGRGHMVRFNSHLLHFISQLCQLMNNAVSFDPVLSFLYGIKPYIMKHVVKGGILAFVVICLYAFITVVASAL
jgi:hypothetical protein